MNKKPNFLQYITTGMVNKKKKKRTTTTKNTYLGNIKMGGTCIKARKPTVHAKWLGNGLVSYGHCRDLDGIAIWTNLKRGRSRKGPRVGTCQAF